jgi:hypothetical protein
MAFLLHMRLDAEQIARLSNIFDNAGQVALGGLVFAPLLSPIDNYRGLVILFGVVDVLICWTVSLWLAAKKKDTYEF